VVAMVTAAPLAPEWWIGYPLDLGTWRPPRDPWQCCHAGIKSPTQRGGLREHADYGRSVLRRHTLLGASRSQPPRR